MKVMNASQPEENNCIHRISCIKMFSNEYVEPRRRSPKMKSTNPKRKEKSETKTTTGRGTANQM